MRVLGPAGWAAAAGAAAGALTALYAWQFDRQAFRVQHRHAAFDAHVTAVTDDRVRIRRRGPLEPPIIGLEYPGGHAVLDLREGDWYRVSRVWGRRPVRGMPCRFDSFVFPGDPAVAHGISFQEVRYPSELGACPAWLVPGRDAEAPWLIAIHGKGASPREVLRILPVIHRAGWTVLAIGYRNDIDAPRSPDGRYGFGLTEWRDVEAAVRFAVERGAHEVALFGYSMGGAIAASFLRRSELAARVAAVGFDAPMLDLRATVQHRAQHQPLPAAVHRLLLPVAGRALRVPWEAVRYLDDVDGWPGPVFLAHGTADPLVPVATSDEAAARLGGRGRYVRVEGAGHVRSWNAEPGRYERELEAWLVDAREAAGGLMSPRDS